MCSVKRIAQNAKKATRYTFRYTIVIRENYG